MVLIDGVEELAADAGVFACVASVRNHPGFLVLIVCQVVAFGNFLADNFVVDGCRLGKGDNVLSLASGGEGVASPSVCKGDEVALAFRFDSDVVFFIGFALAEMEGGAGDVGVHGISWFSCGLGWSQTLKCHTRLKVRHSYCPGDGLVLIQADRVGVFTRCVEASVAVLVSESRIIDDGVELISFVVG